MENQQTFQRLLLARVDRSAEMKWTNFQVFIRNKSFSWPNIISLVNIKKMISDSCYQFHTIEIYTTYIYVLTDQNVITLSLITFLFIYLQILFSAQTQKMMNCEIFANAVKKVVMRVYTYTYLLKVTWCFDKCCSHTFHQIRSKWMDVIDGMNKNLWIW